MNNHTYIMVFSKQNVVFGYILLVSAKELSESEKNNLTTIFETVSFILGSMVANINFWTDAMLRAVEKGLIPSIDEEGDLK